MTANGTFKPAQWEEKQYEQISPLMKMTRVSATYLFNGRLEGEATVEYLMFYKFFDDKDPHRSEAAYVGLSRFTGKVDGKAGNFVMEDRGTFQGREARSRLTILPSSGTGDLLGITGSGSFTATPKGSDYRLEYEIH